MKKLGLLILLTSICLFPQDNVDLKTHFSQGDLIKIPAPVGVSSRLLRNTYDLKFNNLNT